MPNSLGLSYHTDLCPCPHAAYADDGVKCTSIPCDDVSLARGVIYTIVLFFAGVGAVTVIYQAMQWFDRVTGYLI
jgi:hypothetical protein